MNEKEKDLYLNWKGLELIHSLKTVFKWIMIILSIGFLFISIRFQNYYIFGASLAILFFQIMSENNKEFYLKYKEIFEKSFYGRKCNDQKNWTDFLEKTSGLNSFTKWTAERIFNKKFEKLLVERYKK